MRHDSLILGLRVNQPPGADDNQNRQCAYCEVRLCRESGHAKVLRFHLNCTSVSMSSIA